ncbi:MAG: hypothetical protein QME81_12760 [bacterium]|nr:hypothetical protein [bacterium]
MKKVKKVYAVGVMGLLLLSLSFFSSTDAHSATKKGGAGPFFGSCCVGPRIGLEMNEGVEVELMEVLRLAPYVGGLIHLYVSYDYGYKAAGEKGFLASCCIGPRVGKEFNERKIRTKEWMRLIPVVGLVPHVMIAIEAGQGKTMTEIEQEENLKK